MEADRERSDTDAADAGHPLDPPTYSPFRKARRQSSARKRRDRADGGAALCKVRSFIAGHASTYGCGGLGTDAKADRLQPAKTPHLILLFPNHFHGRRSSATSRPVAPLSECQTRGLTARASSALARIASSSVSLATNSCGKSSRNR